MLEMEKRDNIKNIINGEDIKDVRYLREKIALQEKEINTLQSRLVEKNINVPSDKISNISNSDPDYPDYFESTLFYQNFFNEMPYLIWVKDKYGKFIKANFSFLEKLGIDKSRLGSISDFDIFPWEFAEKFRNDDLEVMKSGKQKVIDELIYMKDSASWFETIRYPIFSSNGEIIGTAGLAKDIGKRKENENALLESEEKFRELAENINIVFIIKAHNKIIYVNPAFEKVFGYKSEILYKNVKVGFDWIYKDDIERIIDKLASERYKETYKFDEQYRVVKSDGSIIWIWHRSTPVFDFKGEISKVVHMVTDISEIKNLEKKLRKSKFQQQAILNNIPHLAWLKDTEGYFVSANQSFCRFHNKKLKDIEGKTDYDLCPPQMAKDYIEKDNLVLQERETKCFYEVEDGKFGKRYSETYKTPVLNENGEVIGIAGISRDITEQKLAENALLKSEEKYKDLVTLLPEIVFETDDKGIISFVNLKALEAFGYSHSDIEKGISIFDIIAPEDYSKAKINFARAKKGAAIGGSEYSLICADKSKIQLMVFTNSMYQDSKYIGLRGVAIDITEKKKAENQEKEYQSRLLFLSETALDFLEMSHKDNIFEYIGSRLEQLVVGGKIIISRFDDESSVLTMEYFSDDKKYLEDLKVITGQDELPLKIKISPASVEVLKTHAEHVYEFRDGIYEVLLGSFTRHECNKMERLLKVKKLFGMSLMRSGKLYGFVLILNNLREPEDKTLVETFIYQASIALHKRQLENELFITKEKAVESDKLKTAFISNMSHEIRTPMNGILGLTQLLHNSRLTENDKKEYLSLINTNGKILLNLLNDIIDISRIESNQLDMNESVFSVEQLFKDLEQFFRSEKKVKQKELIEFRTVNELNTENSAIKGDLQKIQQILTNLVSNAFKFTYQGEIEVGCRLYEEDKILFFVRDTGIGIAKDQLEYVFNRFTQVDHSLTRPFGGSGLGLAICKGFIERMGGRIWVESELNVGSVFYFCLPYQSLLKESMIKIIDKPKSNKYDWSCLCVLVVEDNYISFRLLQLSLQKTGVKILHADNGVKAVEMVEQNPDIKLVLMDIQLPLMNGYDATRRIKILQPDLPVIAQTANATEEDRILCLNAGASDYLTKPINLTQLHQLINDYLIVNKRKISE